MEYKAIDLAVKDIGEDGRTVTGFAAVFGNVDDGYDRLHLGAFKKTLKENGHRVKHLWQHDMGAPPIAAVKELREVDRDGLPGDIQKRYPDATGGLLVRRKYLDTPRGNEILQGIQDGAISEMSFAYDAVKVDFEESNDQKGTVLRNLREVRLWETSDVVWGMNPATVASKSFDYQLTAMSQLIERLKADVDGGRPLAAAECDAVKAAMDELGELLVTAEPPEDEAEKARRMRALTEQLQRRIAIAQRAMI